MCGIAGVWRFGGAPSSELYAAAARMGETIRHRGPDSSGAFVDAEAGVALAHRRLSIIDLSEAGAQPMTSSCGRFTIVYNGELYNTPQLRARVEAAGRAFRGHSDTEAIVEACAAFGVEEAVRAARGMFAFALWDRRARRLTLARDRLGVKPLYWGFVGGGLAFGSELKPIVALGGWTPEVDRRALTEFARYGFVPAPLTIWRGVNKLRAGEIASVGADGEATTSVYWSAEDLAAAGVAGRAVDVDDASAAEWVDRLDALLSDAVARHMVSDVPIGAFLSGGVDSSLVAALMQKASARPVKTFTIAFNEKAFNEAEHARLVAEHLGTDHTEMTVTDGDARDVIPQLPDIYDEPFADPSQIPTYLLSKLTRRHVTVALSGDGGDEFFAGYARYARARAILNAARRAPGPALGALRAALRAPSPRVWDRAFGVAGLGQRLTGDKVYKLSNVLHRDRAHLYRALMSAWPNAEALVVDGRAGDGLAVGPDADARLAAAFPDFLDYMQHYDVATYLPDDILTKVDRASMAVSLETRVPLLDHEVAEWAMAAPQSIKVRDGSAKWALKQTLFRYAPREIIERPKMGFGVPIDSWLRGGLRDWAEDLLSERRLREEGYFEPGLVRQAWSDHLSGARNLRFGLWHVLMFQAWLGVQRGLDASAGPVANDAAPASGPAAPVAGASASAEGDDHRRVGAGL